MWIDPKVAAALAPGARDGNDLAEPLALDIVTAPTMIYAPEEIDWIDRARGLFRDRWGALQRLTDEAIPVPAPPARIHSPADLARYTPPDPSHAPVLDAVRRLRERFPDRAVAVVGESGWAPAVYLRGGMENLFLDMAERPGFARDLMRIGADYHAALYPLAIAAGADVVFLGDDYCDNSGPMMSPRMFEEIILPGDTAVVAAVKRAGARCVKHADGDIRTILDALVGTGIDGLGPLQDVPGMELDALLDRYPGRIAVMGNVNVDLLARAAPEQVARATARLIAQVAAHGPHILSSGNTIASCVRPQNFAAMIRTAHELGRYPIDPARVAAWMPHTQPATQGTHQP